MAVSGSCTTTPAVQLSIGQRITRALINLLARPTVRVNEGAITARELAADDVRTMVPNVVRNVLINGNFDVWQRGGFTNLFSLPTTLATSADKEYTADRWFAAEPSGGAGTRRVYRGTFDLGQTVVPNEPSYYLRWEQQAGGTAPRLQQSVEDVRTFAGKTVTVSWWMKSDTSGTLTVQLVQSFGGSPGISRTITATTGGSAVLTGGAAWAKYTATFAVTNLVGQSIGGTNNCLGLQFIMPSAATFITDFAQVQMEQSSVATDYETHSALYELERCHRYFEFHGGFMAANQVETVSIPIQLDSMTTGAADLVTNYVPGYPFKILALHYVTTKIGVGAGASQVINLEIGTTNLTGGVLTLDEATTNTLGLLRAATAITAANIGSVTDSISVEVAAGGTIFTAGSGILLLRIEKLDVESLRRPVFYFSVRKFRAPTLTLFSANPGSGATFAAIQDTGYSQDTANSVISAFTMKVDAEI